MKYIEEIKSGDVFEYKDSLFILTSDFKKNSSRLAISLNSGFPSWFKPETVVTLTQIFTTDKDSNIIPINNVNNTSENTDISKIPSVAYSTRST